MFWRLSLGKINAEILEFCFILLSYFQELDEKVELWRENFKETKNIEKICVELKNTSKKKLEEEYNIRL